MQKESLLKALRPALIAIGIVLVYIGLWKVLGLPSQEELQVLIKEAFTTYGLWIVFVGAIIEGLLLVGNYFPGGIVIFLGVINTSSVREAVIVIFAVSVAFFISYTCNYFLGKYGWYRLFTRFGLQEELERIEKRLEDRSFTGILLSYWYPALASLTSTAAGVLRFPLKKFLYHSLLGILIWNTFWGVLAYTLKDDILTFLLNPKVWGTVLGVWVVVIMVKWYFHHKKNATE